MTDEEITFLFSSQEWKITSTQLYWIRTYDIAAYNLKHLQDALYCMRSKWGGYWEFEFKNNINER